MLLQAGAADGEIGGRSEEYVTRSLEGWTVHVHPVLLAEEAKLGRRALELLRVMRRLAAGRG